MQCKKALIAAALIAVGGFAMTAGAATNPSTTTFQVSMQITKTCTVSANPIVFAATDANSSGSVNAQSSGNGVSVACSKKTPYIVGLVPSNGNATGAGSMAGQTSGNTDTVAYQLYSDAGRSTKWGNTGTLAAAGNEVAGTGNGVGSGTNFTVYGTATNINVTPDNYADTVTVNVTY
ncbi:Csu type fimbrial protein [Dyella sp.]|uniref:Csu type fimbrial protein n=1 Tax=Dyella sp. TaxID=1869338 RepID=UPI002ED47255